VIEDAAGLAIEALGELGSLADSSSRKRRRTGCGWFALIGTIVILIAVGVTLLSH